jgi:choline dehydrogenase-like flavoprotein
MQHMPYEQVMVNHSSSRITPLCAMLRVLGGSASNHVSGFVMRLRAADFFEGRHVLIMEPH